MTRKVLLGEKPYSIDDIYDLSEQLGATEKALQVLGQYWPAPFRPPIRCVVCQKPMSKLSNCCSSFCDEIKKKGVSLDFLTYGTALALEPVLRAAKDSPYPEGKAFQMISELAERTVDKVIRSQIKVDSTIVLMPNRNHARKWNFNEEIWGRAIRRYFNSHVLVVPSKVDRRPNRFEICPEIYEYVTCDFPDSAHIILVDDYWTTGASTISFLASIHKPIDACIVTIGRQLRPETPSTIRTYCGAFFRCE